MNSENTSRASLIARASVVGRGRHNTGGGEDVRKTNGVNGDLARHEKKTRLSSVVSLFLSSKKEDLARVVM